jgi:hypothetical protein
MDNQKDNEILKDNEDVKSPEDTDTDVDNLDTSDSDEIDSQESAEDVVPLATHLDLKNKYKALKRKQAELEESQLDSEVKAKQDEVYQEWIDKGFDDDTSKQMAATIAKMYQELNKSKKSSYDDFIDAEIDELATHYEDAKSYDKEIRNQLDKAKKLGIELTTEEAYLMQVGVKNKFKENKIASERKLSIQSQGRKPSTPDANSGGKINKVSELSPDDKKALEQLQALQPKAGWDAKKFLEIMKR